MLRQAAVRTIDFLNSIGIDSTFPDRGQPLDKTLEMIQVRRFSLGERRASRALAR